MGVYDLEERTARLGIMAIQVCKKIRVTDVTKPLINQIVRSATSVGANYMEANGADSAKDFRAKIGICKKEAKETMHWARMMCEADDGEAENLRRIWKEAHELSLIFGSINRKNI